MNVEKLAEEYVKQKTLNDSLTKQVGELRELLTKEVDRQGEPDEKGHRWLVAGKYLLQRQKRQGKKFLNTTAAEEWARRMGFWEHVSVTREELSEDALLGYVYEHRKDDRGLEDMLEDLYEEPAPTWAFMHPTEQTPYEY